ncbi:MAG TPA: hypothetical protein VHR66_12050 [Gemmataceae bacterium]|jgi:hypothetical protein|nr:hypothetical protein [Gemmataceae bacterium]
MSDPIWLLGAVRVTARYRAPTGDGSLLAAPPLAHIGTQLDANADRLAKANVHIAGASLGEFRQRARAEAIEAACRYLAENGEHALHKSDRLIVAGHQPEFFHPGVWVKNFVLAGQAQRHGRAALNLVVDNDVVKSPALQVPVVADDPNAVDVEAIPFDKMVSDSPYEERRVADRRLLDSFPDRLREKTQAWGYEPVTQSTWPLLRKELDGGANLGEAISRVRRHWERQWGVHNLELPVSRLAETEAFRGFVHELLTNLPRFVDCYNAALDAYRAANHLRSHHHPAPDLERKGDWIEAPFWVWRADAPRRVKLFARPAGALLELQAGERSLGTIPSDPAGFMNTWLSLTERGWKVRPRALTLTLFSRLGFADTFIHGIGGGKYDEVTDDIIRRFFGIEAPGYSVVSATIRLPIRRFPGTSLDLHRAERAVRDLDWNPQIYPEPKCAVPELVFEKTRLIEDEPADKIDRRGWFRQLQRVTRDMRPVVENEHKAMQRNVGRLRAELAANEILGSREFSWLLFPEGHLRDAFVAQV